MLRLPRSALDVEMASRYCLDERLALHRTREHVILEFNSEDEEGAGWVEDEEAEGWLPALLPLRADLAAGDLRALYMAWLAAAQTGELDDAEREPPLPPGLSEPSAALAALAEFLRVDEDVLAVAAEQSPDLPASPSSAELRRWIQDLGAADKDDLLLRLVQGEALLVRTELLRRYHQARTPRSDTRRERAGRSVGELLAAAEQRAAARRRREAERQAAEEARRAQEEAVARVVCLDRLVGREEEVWSEVRALVETKRPAAYDQAIQRLHDLHDLSTRQSASGAFAARVRGLREQYARRPSFLDRLDRAGLPA
jgi:hypothetical protein